MTTSKAHVETEHASRYLQQLCKHWSHRFTVEFDSRLGRIDFGEGKRVTLTATDTELVLHITVEGVSETAKLENVVAEHLQRFAFRETFAVNWTQEETS